MHPLRDEPQWTLLTRDNSLTGSLRPLLGSELMMDQFNHFNDPCYVFCRFRCPIVSARLENRHDPQLRSWVYKPARDVHDVLDWIQSSTEILEEPINVEALINRANQRKLDHSHEDPVIRCIMFTTPEKISFGVFLHGSHTILDARPTFQAFQIICEGMTTSGPMEKLAWGTEGQNLPDGPVTATGGPRDGWDSAGIELLDKVAKAHITKSVTRSLRPPPKKEITNKGLQLRVHAIIDLPYSHEVMNAVKAAGCTMNHLMEAAQALAICELYPVPDEEREDAHISFPFTVFSLAKWLTAKEATKDRIISSLVTVPIHIDYIDIAAPLPQRERLLKIMGKIKDQYNSFMENPHLPHLTAAQMTLNPPRHIDMTSNPFATTITNLGVIERFTKSEWYSNQALSKDPIFKLQEMSFGHRITKPNPFV
ncbi:hypothetical protein CPB84DRAFT_1733195 [Gymnopilus junonius]|uniref:Uncharacterized protein n=1 Tax=Gymnopilus junonius TaxID=109634 RepID=A0A9P5NHD5_GYMJU|nr:hypothetical protein CPB84DRAFT_1733195 [Gymnopilus junonius]